MSDERKPLRDYIKAAFPDSNLDVDEIARQVRENSAKLNGCPGPHEFEPFEYHRGTDLVRKHKCKKCGGTSSIRRGFLRKTSKGWKKP